MVLPIQFDEALRIPRSMGLSIQKIKRLISLVFPVFWPRLSRGRGNGRFYFRSCSGLGTV
jgi:hypothetical protein